MRFVKFLVVSAIAISVIYAFSNRLVISNVPIPPLGKFLDPNHGFWQNAEVDSFPYHTNLELQGLKNEVIVKYDKNGVPHIFANNNHDLYMTQGYIIAQHRLWQMEFQTHAAAGRVSEIIGKNGLSFDRLQRRKGMVKGAKATYEAMRKEPEINEYLDAYAAGVNQYISSLPYANLPIEYKLLGYEPEEWTPVKSALILEYMIDNLTGYDDDLENTNAVRLFGKEMFDFLFPERLPGVDPVIPTNIGQPWDFEVVKTERPVSSVSEDNIQTALPKPDPDNGSNNWAIAGSKTASGNAILANDTHLGLNLPSLWIMLQLQSPDVNVYGYTFTGAAGITIGFNDSIAWGFTNAPRDHRDWYKIQFKDENGYQYWHDGQWKDTYKEIEKIELRGQEPFYDTITYTHHGPIVYDKSFGDMDSRKNYALRWIGHEPSMVQKALLRLNSADNYQDYLSAIEYWDAPPQNIVFASVSGDIALRVQGNFTAKWKEQGKFLMDGSDPKNDWQALIPKDQNPYQYNPERGFVSSANQHSVDSLYPYWVYDASYEYYRNRTINKLLSEMDSVTVKDIMEMHHNSYSMLPQETLPLMLDSLDLSSLTEQQKEVVNELRQWDYNYLVQAKAPSYFQAWWRQFNLALWDEFDHDSLALDAPGEYTTTYIMKNYPDHEFVDVDSTQKKETLTELINYSFRQALATLEQWKEERKMDYTWGNYKGTFIRHLADLGGSLAGFSHYNVQVNGVADAINSTKRNHGPSQRLIVEMSSPPRAWGIYPGGQSGNPGSIWYDNLIDLWRDGKYIPLLFMPDKEADSDKILFTQTFKPAEK
ncbi:penicillin acylase II [Fulvivirga imtechensis AK7]|uniref:Penicillin acylase II n=1 Tax=Fulvivirga imtechensis AK7 TaxID=1237149 RepID=L8JQS9_9BACT|nr:penicillin acylase family protein [Fulvivirga imtechensis]ELR70578.1 penicillin acylase II [Fulvivirga imtechensis AK7]